MQPIPLSLRCCESTPAAAIRALELERMKLRIGVAKRRLETNLERATSSAKTCRQYESRLRARGRATAYAIALNILTVKLGNDEGRD